MLMIMLRYDNMGQPCCTVLPRYVTTCTFYWVVYTSCMKYNNTHRMLHTHTHPHTPTHTHTHLYTPTAQIPSMHPAAVAIAAMLNTMQCLPAALAQHVATHSTPVSLQQGIVLLHTAHSVECESACGACGRDTWKDACAYTAAGVAHLAAQLAAVDDDAVQWLDNKVGVHVIVVLQGDDVVLQGDDVVLQGDARRC